MQLNNAMAFETGNVSETKETLPNISIISTNAEFVKSSDDVELFRGRGLAAWEQRDDFLLDVFPLLQVPYKSVEDIGTPFPHILPDKDATSGDYALLWRMPDGTVGYLHISDGGNRKQWYSLPEIYASIHYKNARKCSPIENAVWKIRLLVDSGFACPAPVQMPPLPEDATPAEAKVYAAFKLLFGCRWLHSPGQPVMAGWRFMSAWSQVGYVQTGTAITGLLKQRRVIHFRPVLLRRGKSNLFLPIGYDFPDDDTHPAPAPLDEVTPAPSTAEPSEPEDWAWLFGKGDENVEDGDD